MMSCLETTRPGVSGLDSIYHGRRSQRLYPEPKNPGRQVPALPSLPRQRSSVGKR